MPAPRAWPSLLAATVLLLLGAVVAVGIGDALGLTFTPSATPAAVTVSGAIAPLAPAPKIARLAAPAD